MNYPIKTLNQLRLILQGFRKANDLTQAALANKLGITQQSYAQLEANPASASVERLFRVLQVLNVDMVLSGNAPSVSKTMYMAVNVESGQQNFAAHQPTVPYISGISGGLIESNKSKSVKGSTKKIGSAVVTTKKKESW